jgi:pimeloyl-ACP methyl ester carboxylesterase
MNNSIFNHHTAPTRYIEVDGIRFAYRTFGVSSEVPIICLQHFTGTLDNWDPVITNGLATQRQVILIDNRGVGNSDGETPDNVLDMSLDALKVIDTLGIDRCDLLGFSLGGFIAQLMAVQRPELFRKIIIVGSAPQGVKVLHTFPALITKAMQLEPAERFLFIFFTASEKSRSKGVSTLVRLAARTTDRDMDATMQAIAAQIKAITRWGTDPVTIDLAKIEHPVLIVNGSDDEMMESMSSIELFKKIPNAIVSLYPDSAHGSFYQYPEIFVDQANSFLNKFE